MVILEHYRTIPKLEDRPVHGRDEGMKDDQRALGEAILSTKSDAIVAADKHGIIYFWNPGAERIFGYASAEAVGQSLDIIIPERLRKRHWDGYSRVMRGGQSRYESGDVLAVPAIKNDGSRISIEFTIVSLRDGAGNLTGLAAVMRDVTKRFEEMRALKQKLTGTTIAHDRDEAAPGDRA